MACGVQVRRRELLLLLNSARSDPSAMPFSEPRPTSCLDGRKKSSVTVSLPPPSVVGFATVSVVGRIAARNCGEKPVLKPASVSYAL